MSPDRLNFKEFLNQSPEKPVFGDWEIYNLYMNSPNLGVREIAQQAQVSIGEVYRIVRRMGALPNRHQTNHHNVKMFHGAGMPVKSIAQLTGYTPRNVRYILKKDQYASE